MLCHLQVFISKQARRKRRKPHDCIAKAHGGCEEITFKPLVCFTATLAGGSGDSSGCPEGAGPEMLRFENKSVFDVRQSYFFPCRHGCSSEFHVHFFFLFSFYSLSAQNNVKDETGASGPKRHVQYEQQARVQR